jgi:Uridine kinase
MGPAVFALPALFCYNEHIMQILLMKHTGDTTVNIDIEKGTTIEQIYRMYEDEVPYTILAGRLNNRIVGLTHTIEEPCVLTLLDMRSQAANLAYQHGLTMMYLYCIEHVIGRAGVEIQNSLNKGIYTEIKTKKQITAEQVGLIEEAMHKLAEDDKPFVKSYMNRKDTLEFLKKADLEEKRKIVENHPEADRFKLYTLDGFGNFFYDIMPPSTGYIKIFELKKYRRGVLLRFPYMDDPNKLPEYVDEKKMYSAFSEAKRWQRLLDIQYVNDLNEKIADGKMREVILLSEALHEKRIVEIAGAITTQRKRIILIAGPSSSGKTTFARRLCIQLKVNGQNPLYLGTDDYFVNRDETPLDENNEPNYEGLDALDIELFEHDMNALLEGEEVDLPTFDFIRGIKIFGRRRTKLTEGQPIVIEGIHALNNALTQHIADKWKYKIYISPLTQLNIDNHNRIPTTDLRMLRRIVRDNKYRGHSASETILEWPKVRRGEDRNIFPYNAEADEFFNSVHIYELGVLRKYAEPLLRAVGPEEIGYGEAQRLLKLLEFFDVVQDDYLIVNNSILREFIGGSIYVE